MVLDVMRRSVREDEKVVPPRKANAKYFLLLIEQRKRANEARPGFIELPCFAFLVDTGTDPVSERGSLPVRGTSTHEGLKVCEVD